MDIPKYKSIVEDFIDKSNPSSLESLKTCLDLLIDYWSLEKNKADTPQKLRDASVYIDAYQVLRVSFFEKIK